MTDQGMFADGAAMWDRRFAREDFLFGEAPAAFLEAQVRHLNPGAQVLVPCDGEGRNSVWLAEQGYTVTAFDVSEVGVAKARRLAAARGVAVRHLMSGIDDWDWSKPFDAVVAIFVQFVRPPRQQTFLEELGQAVRPGGMLLLHGYAPRQVEYGTGGPPAKEHMYTEPLLRQAFTGWDILHVADYDADIAEGDGHKGRSALVDLVARRP